MIMALEFTLVRVSSMAVRTGMAFDSGVLETVHGRM